MLHTTYYPFRPKVPMLQLSSIVPFLTIDRATRLAHREAVAYGKVKMHPHHRR